MSEPIKDVETAVRELGALPVPVGPERLSPEERGMILGLIADARAATSGLLVSFGESVRNRREHEHPTWEDLYCMNLSSYMGERMAPVLRRLVDVEVENERLRAGSAELGRLRQYAEHKQSREEELLATLGQYNLIDSPDAWALGMTVISHLEGPHSPAAPEELEPGLRKLIEQLRSQVSELEHLRAQRGAIPYVLGDSTIPKDLREQLVALLTEMLRQGVPGPSLTGGMEAQGEMEAALSSAFARKMYSAPGLFPSAAEQVYQLRASLAELKTAQATAYRASHDSIAMGLYTTAAAAREHCETYARRDQPTAELDWIEDEEDGVAELVAAFGEDERSTGYVVTALEVASEYDKEADE